MLCSGGVPGPGRGGAWSWGEVPGPGGCLVPGVPGPGGPGPGGGHPSMH